MPIPARACAKVTSARVAPARAPREFMSRFNRMQSLYGLASIAFRDAGVKDWPRRFLTPQQCLAEGTRATFSDGWGVRDRCREVRARNASDARSRYPSVASY